MIIRLYYLIVIPIALIIAFTFGIILVCEIRSDKDKRIENYNHALSRLEVTKLRKYLFLTKRHIRVSAEIDLLQTSISTEVPYKKWHGEAL